jgi:hypothetical protein
MAKKAVIATYDALGGPEKAVKAPDGFVAGPTDAGNYVIAYCARHQSNRYPKWSGIPWGAALRDTPFKVIASKALRQPKRARLRRGSELLSRAHSPFL